jgi:PKHD-type hydroxylase
MTDFLHVPRVLAPAQVEGLRAEIDKLNFGDGKATAGWHAKEVKHNRQAQPSAELVKLQGAIVQALFANELIRVHALPRAVLPPIFSRYSGGESYGLHIDDAIMGAGNQRMRTDLSVTVFLSHPDQYDGGELEIHTAEGMKTAKLAAGDAVVYPSTRLHQVRPVTRGERVVAVTWIESLVASAERREVLFDLDQARREIFVKSGKSAAFDLIAKSHANLLRMWAQV